ncbi:hypothetical protein BFP72_07430 [Reichenbachiella sp. 5M10]|nr:hypothetical protein BFP72_07430 [Reichenbachiella sp. 5M10]
MQAQNIGINETGASPDASAILDVTSSDKGLLIPRMTETQREGISTPATGLLVYQTDNLSGFWYYTGSVWQYLNGGGEFESIDHVIQSTTDPDYDDFVIGSASLDNASSTGERRMFFDKSKAAFRVGRVEDDSWDEENIGNYSFATGSGTKASSSYSVAMGRSTWASGDQSTALGAFTYAEADYSTAIGRATTASGNVSMAMGSQSSASGYIATAMGRSTIASGDESTSMGTHTEAHSYGETAMGIYSTIYTPNSESTYEAEDRLLTIGNGIDDENRSDALVILKNGSTGLGISTPDASAVLDMTATDKGMLIPRMTETQRTAISSAATGLLVYQINNEHGFWFYNGTEWEMLNDGSSSASGEFERVGGVVRNATNYTTDDFVFGSPQLEYSGNSDHTSRMFFDKSEGSFRAGEVEDDQWDGINRGENSVAMGFNTIASGERSTAMGYHTIASGNSSTAMGYLTIASGTSSLAIGNRTEASGLSAISTGYGTRATGWGSASIGLRSTASGTASMTIGENAIASGEYSFAQGYRSESPSYAETTIGAWATEYTANSATDFDANDRLFTIGNGNEFIRSNALTILKNGNMTVGGELSVEDDMTVDGEVSVEDNGGALNMIGTDHVYMQWYPDGLAAGRKGYIGWTSASSQNFSIVSEAANAHIVLSTASGGNVGIGTAAPTQAKLVVNGSVDNPLSSYGFLNSAGNTGTSTGAGSYSIYATSRIATSEINVFSDQRIKNIQGLSNATKDLALLTKIEVTDYTLKDTIANGNGSIKKVIAQQVKEVYPQAVSNALTSVIPDIYQLAEIKNGWIALPTDLAKGNKVRLIFAEKEVLTEVLETNGSGFRVNLAHTGKVFVYGKEVHDFHTVDYEAISMLNVSATQELAKRIIRLEKEKEYTSEVISRLEQQLNALVDKVTAMEDSQDHFTTAAKQNDNGF